MKRLRLSLWVVVSFLLFPAMTMAVDYTVDINVKGKAFNGTTLFAETSNPARPKLVEVDMNGKVVWEYTIPSHIARGGKPGQALDIEWIPATDTILFVMPFKGIYEVNRNKEIIWEHKTTKVSHDADKLPNGNILYTFAWESKNEAQVTEITPDGTIVWQWFASKHMDPTLRRHPGAINREGFCHTNGAIRLDNGLTRISLRNFNTVVEVDTKGEIVWLLNKLPNGKEIRNVHDPRTLPNGNIILSTHAPQIIMEITRDKQLINKLRSEDIYLVRSHQVLPNGNILATDADKLMEFTPDLREIVWQLSKPGVHMHNLKTSGKQNQNDPRLVGFYKAERIPPK